MIDEQAVLTDAVMALDDAVAAMNPAVSDARAREIAVAVIGECLWTEDLHELRKEPEALVAALEHSGLRIVAAPRDGR